MSRLLVTFYGDDFTGSTDALEQLTLAGLRTLLFIDPPSRKRLTRYPGLRAAGVAGMTRSLKPRDLQRELEPALKKLRALGARHVHYKICSTFDSSPRIGSIGRVIETGAEVFQAGFVPVLAAAPRLGRYTVFGNHFARYGIGSAGAIHRLDRHPSVSRHPTTPMTEADLRLHLAGQTKLNIALFDIQRVALPWPQARAAFKRLLDEKPDAVLFDALYQEQLSAIGRLLDGCASVRRPLFSVGSSGIDMALGAHWARTGRVRPEKAFIGPGPVESLLAASGSCSPVTAEQIAWGLQHGFEEVFLDPLRLATARAAEAEIEKAADVALEILNAGRSVLVHTTQKGSDRRVTEKLKSRSARIIGTAVGRVLRRTLERSDIRRICIAGGDTSSYAARVLGIEAIEMIAPLTPGAPLCRVHAPNSPMDGREVVFKGGQVGSKDYLHSVLKGKQ